MTGKEMIKLMERNGWTVVRIRGSHYILEKDGHSETVPAHPGKDLKKGLEHTLIKRWGLK